MWYKLTEPLKQINVFPGRKQDWLYASLCIITIAIVFVTTGVPKGATFLNAKSIFYCELLFIALYFIILRDPRSLYQNISHHPIELVIFLLWICSITLSFYLSPINLAAKNSEIARFYQEIMITRYYQTIMQNPVTG